MKYTYWTIYLFPWAFIFYNAGEKQIIIVLLLQALHGMFWFFSQPKSYSSSIFSGKIQKSISSHSKFWVEFLFSNFSYFFFELSNFSAGRRKPLSASLLAALGIYHPYYFKHFKNEHFSIVHVTPEIIHTADGDLLVAGTFTTPF